MHNRVGVNVQYFFISLSRYLSPAKLFTLLLRRATFSPIHETVRILRNVYRTRWSSGYDMNSSRGLGTRESLHKTRCHDERFLNFRVTVFDDKLERGYHHDLIYLSSRTFFCIQWLGWYFVFRVLPFGWKASAWLYHIIIWRAWCMVTNTIRFRGIPVLQYIDNRYAGSWCELPQRWRCRRPNKTNDHAAYALPVISWLRRAIKLA